MLASASCGPKAGQNSPIPANWADFMLHANEVLVGAKMAHL